ncbi:MAG: glycosyltransferase family 4 protein [Spirochaetia bacterium]|nr:glycosyltransferase family 4 protein [Spirochaetia bacterium]
MKIAIATVQVPFITGGAEILALMLRDELRKRGHQAEIVTIPFKWYPVETLIKCMMMGRMMDLTEVNGEKIDCVIAMKFPAYYVKHDNKIIWLMHQHRQAYDLWETKYGDLHNFSKGKEIRQLIEECDKKYLSEARLIYSIAKNTATRLKKYCGIDSVPLYHPPYNYEKLRCQSYGDYIFYASRIDQIKRQRILVEAMKYVKSPVTAIIAGTGAKREIDFIKKYIFDNHLDNKVKLVGYISDEEKIHYYANCLGVYFGAFDEDYGYITLESFFSKKPILVHKDSGGPLEFVRDGKNGFIIENEPKEVAKKIDYWFDNKEEAKKQGESGYCLMQELNINWDYIIKELLSNNYE